MAFYPLEEPQLTNFTPIAKEAVETPKLTNFTPLEESRTLKTVPVTSKAPGELEKAAAQTIEGVAGESLALANLVASAPEFVMATGFTVMDALNQLPAALIDGKDPDWKRARETGQRVAKPFGIVSRGLNKLVDYTKGSDLDLSRAMEESKVNQGLTALSTGIQKGAAATEKATGIPKEAVETVADVLMVLGVPGAKDIKSKVSEVLSRPTSKSIADYQNTVKANLGYQKPNRIMEYNNTLLDTVDTPKVLPKTIEDHKSLQEGFIELQGRAAADNSIALKLDAELKDISPETQNKFRQELEKERVNAEEFETKMTSLESRHAFLVEELNTANKARREGTVAYSRDGTRLLDPVQITEQIKRTREDAVRLSKEPKKFVELNPAESALYHLVPYKQVAKSKELIQKLIEKGRLEDIPMSAEFAPRRRLPAKPKGFIESLTKDTSALDKDYATPDAAEKRTLFVLENKLGSRKVVTESNGNLLQIYKQKMTALGKAPAEGLKPGTKIGNSVVKEATQAEIARHTGKEYSKNTTMSTTQSLAETRELARTTEYIDNWMGTDHFKDNAVKLIENQGVPEGYIVPEGISNRTPQLRGYAFKPETAYLLEDFNRVVSPTALTKGSDLIVKTMMILPFKHMHNELYHWYVTRGASKFASPKAWVDLVATMGEAYSEVVTQGPKYQQLLREGGSLMSDRSRNLPAMEDALRKGTVELLKDKNFREIAKLTGRTPADMMNAVSRFSNKAMWTSRDILYMQLALEKGYNAKPGEYVGIKEAARDVERHMPSYRLPTKILGSRGLQKVLNNKNWFIFARYKHGMLSSGLNTVKDIAMLDKTAPKSKQIRDGVDSAIATAVALSIVYPVLDDFYTRLFNKTAEVRRPGFAHVLSTVGSVATAEKDPFALLSVVATMNPILQMFVETAAGYELYNRQPIYYLNDKAKVIWADYRKYLLKKIPMLSDMTRANEEVGGGAGEFARNMFDINTKSYKEKAQAKERAAIRKTSSKNREKEYEEEN
jgi:hypothetical protein